MTAEFKKDPMDPSGFVLLADYVPGIVQEIRYYSTYNFIGDRIDGYEATLRQRPGNLYYSQT